MTRSCKKIVVILIMSCKKYLQNPAREKNCNLLNGGPPSSITVLEKSCGVDKVLGL